MRAWIAAAFLCANLFPLGSFANVPSSSPELDSVSKALNQALEQELGLSQAVLQPSLPRVDYVVYSLMVERLRKQGKWTASDSVLLMNRDELYQDLRSEVGSDSFEYQVEWTSIDFGLDRIRETLTTYDDAELWKCRANESCAYFWVPVRLSLKELPLRFSEFHAWVASELAQAMKKRARSLMWDHLVHEQVPDLDRRIEFISFREREELYAELKETEFKMEVTGATVLDVRLQGELAQAASTELLRVIQEWETQASGDLALRREQELPGLVEQKLRALAESATAQRLSVTIEEKTLDVAAPIAQTSVSALGENEVQVLIPSGQKKTEVRYAELWDAGVQKVLKDRIAEKYRVAALKDTLSNLLKTVGRSDLLSQAQSLCQGNAHSGVQADTHEPSSGQWESVASEFCHLNLSGETTL